MLSKRGVTRRKGCGGERIEVPSQRPLYSPWLTKAIGSAAKYRCGLEQKLPKRQSSREALKEGCHNNYYITAAVEMAARMRTPVPRFSICGASLQAPLPLFRSMS